METAYKEKIVLELDASGVKGNSLSGLISQLEAVEGHIQKINTALSGVKLGPGAARSVKELEAEIQRLQSKMGTSLKASDLSKNLGLEQKEFERFLARQKANLKDYQSTLQQFRSAPAAARAVARFEREGAAGRARLGDLLRPSVASVQGGGAVGGKIALEIPASQVQASVVGTIQLNIPGSQLAGAGRNPETGEFVSGGGGKRGAKGPLGSIPAGKGQRELQRVRVETDKYLRETITAVDEAGNIIATVHDSVEGVIKTSRKTATGRSALEQFREARRIAEENFKQLRAAIDPNDPGIGLAKLQQKQADQLRALLQAPFMKSMGAPQREAIRRQIKQQALTLEARSQETFRAALDFRGYGLADVRQRLGLGPVTPGGFPPLPPGARGRRGYASPIGPMLPSGYGSPIGPQIPVYTGPTPPLIPPPKMPVPAKTPVSPFARGLRSFTPTGFAANLLNVSGWAAAVAVLYKGIELASYSLERFINIGQQSTRLGVVFRGVGGSVKELTDDVLQLAAANGRDTEEAMESATEWSRLGLSRQQINEAVRVSLEAANVAGMHATETTKQLASLMHIYNLEVGDLSGVLGMLTTTSQRYNVTLEDLFQGLDRSAGSAKLARVGLAELQGFIGTVVGKTGQSGTVVGNTIKSLLVQFSNPDVQQYLRRFGVETLDKNLNQKSGSQILQELFVKWQTLDDRQKQGLTWRLVGRLSAARFVPIMTDYVQAQKMAIESQLNLNSAQEANSRIVGTLKSQLAGLRAEWDRLVVTQGNLAGMGGGSPMDILTGGVRTGKNLLKLFNQSGFGLWQAGVGAYNQMPGTIPLPQRPGIWMDLFNRWMEGATGRRQTEQLAFAQRTQGLTSQSGALATRGRLLDTIATVLPAAKGGSLESMLGVAGSQMSDGGAALRKALASGDMAGAQAILRQAGKSAQAESLQKSGEALSSRTQRLGELNLSLQNINAEIAALEKQGAAQGELNKKKEEQKELESEIRDMDADKSRASDDYAREAAEVSDVVELKQQYLNLLKEEEMVQQGIAQLSEQQTLGTAGSRLDAQVNALNTSIELMKAQKEALDERGGAEDTQAAEELRKRIAEAEAQQAALQSPQMQAIVQTVDNREIAARRAQQEAAAYAVGYTETEKLLNQRREIQQRIQGIEGQPFRTENDRVRIKELEIQLWQTQEKIQARIIDLARQEKQIRIDSTREFQRNLLLAGPGEQLQRLYVANLASRGIGSGEFNALSPELKRMFYELKGGEAGARVREELGLVNGQGMTVEQEQAAYGAARGRVAFSGRLLDGGRFPDGGRSWLGNRLAGQPPMPLPPLDPLVTSGKAASEQLTAVAGSAERASKALDGLVGKMERIANRTVTNPSVAPPRLDLMSGFALGSQH